MATGPWKSIDADRPLVIMPATPYTRPAAAPYVASPAGRRGAVTSVRTRFNGSRALSGGSALSAPFSRTKPALKASVVTSASTTPRITAARPGSRAPCLDQQDAGGGRPVTEQAIQRPQHERDVQVRRARHALAGEAARGEEPGQRPLGEHVQVARL